MKTEVLIQSRLLNRCMDSRFVACLSGVDLVASHHLYLYISLPRSRGNGYALAILGHISFWLSGGLQNSLGIVWRLLPGVYTSARWNDLGRRTVDPRWLLHRCSTQCDLWDVLLAYEELYPRQSVYHNPASDWFDHFLVSTGFLRIQLFSAQLTNSPIGSRHCHF